MPLKYVSELSAAKVRMQMSPASLSDRELAYLQALADKAMGRYRSNFLLCLHGVLLALFAFWAALGCFAVILSAGWLLDSHIGIMSQLNLQVCYVFMAGIPISVAYITAVGPIERAGRVAEEVLDSLKPLAGNPELCGDALAHVEGLPAAARLRDQATSDGVQLRNFHLEAMRAEAQKTMNAGGVLDSRDLHTVGAVMSPERLSALAWPRYMDIDFRRRIKRAVAAQAIN